MDCDSVVNMAYKVTVSILIPAKTGGMDENMARVLIDVFRENQPVIKSGMLKSWNLATAVGIDVIADIDMGEMKLEESA